MDTPKTLSEAIQSFANPDNAIRYFSAKRWPDGVACPYCEADEPMFLSTRKIWKCRKCRKQFSVKVGTIFEDSAIPLSKWLTAMWLIANCKNGVSSYEIARDLGITQKSAWFMLQRIRQALQGKKGGKIGGHIEVDETFIGGKARNMHLRKRRERIQGRGVTGKAVVIGMLQRGGQVRTAIIDDRDKETLHGFVRENVRRGASVYTDELLSYYGLDSDYTHQVINHAEEYVRGQVHTNGMENFWSLLKRGLSGTYVSVEPFHLFRYIDEQAFRYNNRKDMTDADRFALACSLAAGKRLAWNELTGKAGAALSAQPAF